MATSDRRPTAGLLRWAQPWYAAYGLDGLVILGVGPMLIPLTVRPRGAAAVGLVVAAFYVGALFSPLAGALADHRGSQRIWFLSCFPAMAITLVLFGYAHSTWLWAVLAAVFGGAGAIAGSIGAAFVVEPNPPSEWNKRISWFRLSYGAGQVAGLVIAAITASRLLLGWWIAGVAILPGILVGRWGLPRLRATTAVPQHLPVSGSFRSAPGVHSVLHGLHRPSLGGLKEAVSGRFGLFMLTWLIVMIGVQTFFNVVPLVMRDAFRVNASVSSLLFMVGAAIGSMIFPALATLANRIGPGRVLGLGVVIMLVCFVTMAVMSWLKPSWEAFPASAALVLAAVAYSFIVVGATMLIARLSPVGEGEAMGLLNSAIAAGAIIGAIVPSYVAAAFGYPALPLLAALVLAAALLVGSSLLFRQAAAPSMARPGLSGGLSWRNGMTSDVRV